MIHVGKDDSIMDIVLKMNHCPDKELVLEFDFWHPILHNYLSLKILKNKAEPKKLIITTSDVSSKKIGKKLGIKYTIIKDPKFIEEESILKHNFTFLEYLKYELRNYYNQLKGNIKQNKQVNSLMKYRYSVYNDSFGVSIFIGWFIISLLLFIFIFYFAVNKTYVYISPDIKIETRSSNFIFKTAEDESIFDWESVIRLTKYSETMRLEKEFSTTGIADKSTKKANGTITLYNKLEEKIDLKANTRVRREDGVEYIITSRVSLPAAINSDTGTIEPSSITTNIIANNYDASGRFVWERWNTVEGTLLILPGLEDELKSKIYAKTLWEIEGGSNNYERTLLEQDIEKAQDILETQLKNEVIRKAKAAIEENNSINNTQLDILGVNNAIEYSDAEIQLPVWIQPWDQIENFRLSGNISVDLYLYDKQLVINKLKKTVNDGILDWVEELIMIDKDSLRVSNVIYSLSSSVEIKATSEVEILLRHNFLNPEDVFVQKLKDKIIGLGTREAETILRNTEKIEDARVLNRPFFISKIVNIPANIIFKIDEN